MKELLELYQFADSIRAKGFAVGEDVMQAIAEAEERYISTELVNQLQECAVQKLAGLQTPLRIEIEYQPGQEPKVEVIRKRDEEEVLIASEPEVEETKDDGGETRLRMPKAKSIGFSVSFKDGTVYHEKKAVDTWLLALKKVGLENICNNRSSHKAWHRVDGKDVCIVERTVTVRSSDGKSPQDLVDGFYVMTQLSNPQKVKDLQYLAEYLPKLGIKVTWDSEDVDKPSHRTPTIDENASQWNLPIKEQFRHFLSRVKSESTANSYTSTLDNAVRTWISREVDKEADSVFSYTTAEDVRLCIEMLEASTAYVEENDRKHHSMSAALNQYLLFIEEREKER